MEKLMDSTMSFVDAYAGVRRSHLLLCTLDHHETDINENFDRFGALM